MKEYIRKIVDDGDLDNMYALSEMLEDLLYEVKKENEEEYKEYELTLYKMAYGNKLNEDIAENIVENMKPYGMKWTMETTNEVKAKHSLDVDDVDFFVVMNSAYNDYHDIFQEDVEMYVKYAKDFIKDEDAKDDKVFLYFTTIVK